jgi:hypothetical protein
MKKKLLLITILYFITPLLLFSQPKHSLTRTQIEEALRSGGKYMMNVMIDNEGKSRCDYNMITSQWEPYETPWHTGQAINALVETYLVLKDDALLKKAVQAGNWWVGLEIKDHPKLNGMIRSIHGADIGQVIVYATCTDGTPGLFNLSRVTGDKKYAKVATRAGIWLHTNMLDSASGLSYDCVDPISGEINKKHSGFWKNKENQTLTDVARPNAEGSLFLDMYRFTDDERYKKWFIDQLNVMVTTQSNNGLWMDFTPNNKEEGTLHPRFNLWYAEALMNGYFLTKNEKYLNAALKCARFYQSIQMPDGTLYYKNYVDKRKPNPESISGSGASLAGIVWLQLVRAGRGEEFISNIEKTAKWIYTNRYPENHADPNLRGAYLNPRQRDRNGTIWIVNRDLGTTFGMRFLCDYFKFVGL